MSCKLNNLNELYNKDSDISYASLIIGKFKTGRSTLAKDIMAHCKPVTKTVLFTNNILQCKYDNVDIISEYDTDVLNDIIRRQTYFEPTPILIIFDDCLYMRPDTDTAFKTILFRKNELKINSIVIMQYPIGMSPYMRLWFDYVFAFKDSSFFHQRRLYDMYFGMVQYLDVFSLLMASLEDYECLVSAMKCHRFPEPWKTCWSYKVKL